MLTKTKDTQTTQYVYCYSIVQLSNLVFHVLLFHYFCVVMIDW